MRNCEIYAILDREVLKGYNLLRVAEGLVDNGVRIIQYRDKISTVKEVLENSFRLKKELEIPVFIINDYTDIAMEVDADGIHLGQEDMSVKSARDLLGAEKLIGKSTHNSAQALDAQSAGADYIGIGPVFKTTTKKGKAPIGLEAVREIVREISIPCVAIGGINKDNYRKVLHTGIKLIAAASAVRDSAFPWFNYSNKTSSLEKH